jgi:hypothetical protein
MTTKLKTELPTQPEDLASLKLETVRLDEMEYRLPIGIFRKDGSVVDSFELNEYTGSLELELSALSQRKKRKTTEVLPQFLPSIVKSFGDIALKEFAKAEELSIADLFNNIYLADALTILLQLRVESYGPGIRLAGQCTNCGTKNVDSEQNPSDLSSVEIKRSSAKSSLYTVALKQGVTLFPGETGEERIEALTLRPLRLREFAKIQASNDSQIGLDYRLALMSVVGTPTETDWAKAGSYNGVMSQALVEDLFNRLKPGDRAIVLRAASKLSGLGPLMTSSMTCKNCGTEFDVAIPWQDLSGFLSGII